MNKNNLHELLAQPKINNYIKYHIANQNRQDARGVLKKIFKTIYSKLSSEPQEEIQSYAPPKTRIEASAFLSYESNFVIYDINEKGYDGLVHIEHATPYLQQQVNRHGNVKIMVRVRCWVLSKKDAQRYEYPFTARQMRCSKTDDFNKKLLKAQQEVITNIENAQLHESGMELEQVIQYEIGVGEYTIWRGRSYIELPSWISVKKACVNINNNDNKCFEYSVKCGWYDIHTKTNPQIMSHYKDENFKDLPMSQKISFECCEYPMKVCDDTIREFEMSNVNRVSINIYQVHEKELQNHYTNELDLPDDVLNTNHEIIIPIYYTKNTNKYAQHIDLLYLIDSETNKEHFVYIKDFNKLMGSNGKHRTYYCKHCVQPFSSEEKLKYHINRGCYNIVGTIRVLPKKDDKWIEYEPHKMVYKERLCPFVCHADFECFCVKEHKHDEEDTATSSNEPNLKKAKQTTRTVESNHNPNSYSINIEVREDYVDIVNKHNLKLFYLHRDEHEDAVEAFIHQMIEIEEQILSICKKSMSNHEYGKFKLPIFSII